MFTSCTQQQLCNVALMMFCEAVGKTVVVGDASASDKINQLFIFVPWISSFFEMISLRPRDTAVVVQVSDESVILNDESNETWTDVIES